MGLQTRRDPKQRSPLRFSQRGRDPAAPARLAATQGYRSFRLADNQTELPRDHKPSKNPALRVERTVAKSAGYQRHPVAVSLVPDDTLPKPPDPFLLLRRLRDRYEPAPLSDLNRGNSDLTNVSSRITPCRIEYPNHQDDCRRLRDAPGTEQLLPMRPRGSPIGYARRASASQYSEN